MSRPNVVCAQMDASNGDFSARVWAERKIFCLGARLVASARMAISRSSQVTQPLPLSPDQPRPAKGTQDVEDAMNNPMAAWPKYAILYPSGNPTLFPTQPIPSPAFEGVSPRGVFALRGNGPMSWVLLASGAAGKPSGEFRGAIRLGAYRDSVGGPSI